MNVIPRKFAMSNQSSEIVFWGRALHKHSNTHVYIYIYIMKTSFWNHNPQTWDWYLKPIFWNDAHPLLEKKALQTRNNLQIIWIRKERYMTELSDDSGWLFEGQRLGLDRYSSTWPLTHVQLLEYLTENTALRAAKVIIEELMRYDQICNAGITLFRSWLLMETRLSRPHTLPKFRNDCKNQHCHIGVSGEIC